MAQKKSKVLGVKRLITKLEKLKIKHGPVTVSVGYTANYALRVHEDLEAHHTVGKSKYLEDPFRELQDELQSIVRKTAKVTKSMASGLTTAGLRVQRESQKQVPVDTGNLKNSAFTRKDDGLIPVE